MPMLVGFVDEPVPRGSRTEAPARKSGANADAAKLETSRGTHTNCREMGGMEAAPRPKRSIYPYRKQIHNSDSWRLNYWKI